MKACKFILLILAVISQISCSCNHKEQTQELKVLSWNIWHGGHSEKYPGKSCEGALGILKKSDADIITMVETYGNSNMVASHLGYYHRLLSSNLSIYSRYPIIDTYTYPDIIDPFNFGGVMINVNGKKIRVFDVWLNWKPSNAYVPVELTSEEINSWSDAGTRDDEILKIMGILKPFMEEADEIPIIIAGDFNNHSHLDWIESTKDMYNHGGRVVDWTVTNIIQDNNFKDSFRELHPDPSKSIEELGPTWLWKKGKRERLDRIDYIFYQGSSLNAVSSESYACDIAGELEFKGESFFYPSDHGFLMTTFALNGRFETK